MPLTRLRESIFPNVPPYLTFIGPNEKYDDGDDPPDELVIHYTLAHGTSKTVSECVERFGAKILEWSSADFGHLPGPAWDMLLVCEKSHPVDYSQLPPETKISKFPTTSALSRKDKMWVNYRRMQKKHGKKFFAFLPETYNLPADLKLLQWKMKKNPSIWIAKPPGASCGNGIVLVKNYKDIPERKNALSVQKYITNPMLINGLKFDLRLYVVMTSVDPIKLYIYEDGLVRFATRPYSPSDENLNDKFIHLTNYSVNKDNEDFEYNEAPGEFVGHKWSLKTFWKYMESQGHDWPRIWTRIKNVMVKTIMCGHADILQVFNKEANSDYSCYKLFGVDIFLDDKLKPWLLELNNFPSLENPTLDRFVNEPMIAEMFNIVGFHFSGKPNNKQKIALKNKYKLKNALDFESRLYTREKTEEQVEKEDYYTQEDLTEEEYEELADEEQLTARDIKILIRAEEELTQCKGFSRIFPRKDSSKFLNYLETISYSDILLDAWERKYGNDRSKGREILSKLCLANLHLKNV